MIELPNNSKEVVQKTKTDFEQEVPESNPFLKASWIGALCTALGKRVYAFYKTMVILINQLFPDTATGDYLDRWFGVLALVNNPATKSNGFVTFTGSLGATIPNAATMASTSGITFNVITGDTIANRVTNIISITRSGSVAQATTDVPHNLTSDVAVDIVGATESEYNGLAIAVTPIDAFTFEYTVSGTPATPASGTITGSYDIALVEVESSSFGAGANVSANERLTLSSPIAGINSTGRADPDGISGGTDAEDDEAKRERLLDYFRNPVTNFNAAQLEQVMKSVTGVTRTWVFDAVPNSGFVTCYFVRDGDSSIFPDAGEVATVRNKILEIKPATTAEANIVVESPTDFPSDFTFTSLFPDTPSMRQSIKETLAQYFLDFGNVGIEIPETSYLGAIASSIDPETGVRLQTFIISESGAIAPPAEGLPTLGVVTFP